MTTISGVANKKARRIALIIGIIALLFTIGAFLLPIPLTFQIPLALGLVVATMHTGACIIYFSSLKKFSLRLKVAYFIICSGSIFIAAGTIQLLVVNALGWQQTPWVVYGGTELPILIGLLLGLTGYARFAVLLARKRARWIPLIVLGMCLSMFLVVPFLPHVPKEYSELALDVAMSLSAMQNIVLVAGIILLMNMRRYLGNLYTGALGWTIWAFIFGALATGQQFFQYVFLPDDHWYVTYRLYIISIGVSGVFSLMAALAFSAIPSAGDLPNRPKEHIPEQQPLSLLDLVLFTGNLASDKRAVEFWLHRVRVLAEATKTSTSLSPAVVKILADTYGAIEDYLVSKEPVRSYDRAELRKLVASRFLEVSGQADFWQLVEKSKPLNQSSYSG